MGFGLERGCILYVLGKTSHGLEIRLPSFSAISPPFLFKCIKSRAAFRRVGSGDVPELLVEGSCAISRVTSLTIT